MSTIRVDKIMPFQSSSVEIVGSFNGTYTGSFTGSFVGDGSGLTGIPGATPIETGSFATTGSNTFDGDQLIQGTLTASIQEGYVLVGGAGDVSILAATSSFGGGGSTDISSLNSFTESADGRLDNLELSTGSFATTGSNTFVGSQIVSSSILVSGSVNADGFELDASTTTTIPVLNEEFNSDFSGSIVGTTSTFINKSLVLGDGKVLVAGRFTTVDGHATNDIARFNSDGTLDNSFSAPIFSGSNFGGGDAAAWINTFVTQSDDKIVVGGNFWRVDGDVRYGIARLNTNGTLDTTFVTQSFDSFSNSGGVRDIVIQNDDKIVFVGNFTSGSRRVNTDGTLDTSFDISQGNNQALSFNNGNFYSVALLDSGSEQAILIGGNFVQWGGYNYPYLVKLNPNGTLDFGFAGSNLDLITGGDYTDRIEKIKVGDDGNIYIAGKFRDTGIGNHAGFAIVTPDDQGNGVGAIDTGFRTYISGSFVNDFDFYDGDKILLGGNFTLFGNPAFSVTSANRFAIIRQSTGGLVTNWSTDGLASKYNLNTGSVNSVSLLSGDNVLVGGTFTSASFPADGREGLASLKLTGFGDVTTTSEYTITADSTRLLVSSSTTQFSGDVNIVGTLTATEYIVSSSISHITTLFSSGSTQFGDSVDDTHQFTGSVLVNGSVNATSINGSLTGSVNILSNKSIIYEGGNIVLSSNGLTPNLSGSSNIVIGYEAGLNNRALFNTFIGQGAGRANAVGNQNVYVGINAGYNNVSGSNNAFFGPQVSVNGVSGSENSIFGFAAGGYNNGNYNTFMGSRAAQSVSTGSQNVVVGGYAATGSTTSEYLRFLSASVIVGYGASPNNDNPINQVIIGHDAIGNGNNTVTLGNDGITNTYLKGVVSGSSFTGSFVGDGSGLIGVLSTLATGSFATTGSNTFVGNQIVSASVDVSGSVTATTFQIETPPTYSENTAYWLQTSFTIPGGISFGFSEGNSIANIDNVYINETSSNTNGESIVNSLSWINGLVIGDVITIQGVSGAPSNLNQTIVLSVNSITDFEDGTWNIGVSVVSSTPEAAPVNGSLYSLTYTTTTGDVSYTISGDESRLLVSSSNTQFGGDVNVSGSLNVSGSVNVDGSGFIILSQLSASQEYADDFDAAAGGVPLGGLYRYGGMVRIRIT